MPYKKLKEERYQNLGGLNTKVSAYLNGPMEFTSLENLDFQIPGALTKRWGSTQMFGQSLSGKVDGLYEFTKTNGSSMVFAAAGGTMVTAAINGASPFYSGSTSGPSYFIGFGYSNVDYWTLGSSLNLDFDTLQNQAFFANQKSFLKTNGSSNFFFGLPRPVTCTHQIGNPSSQLQDTFFVNGFGSSGNATGFTGIYYYKIAYINSYGMQGAPSVACAGYYPAHTTTQGCTNIAISMNGLTLGTKLIPPNFDITAIGIYRAGPFGTSLANFADSSQRGNVYLQGVTFTVFNQFEAQVYTFVGQVGVSAGSVAATFIDSNVSVPGLTLLNKNVLPWNWYSYDSFVTGGVLGYSTGTFGTTFIQPPVGTGITLIPSMFEIQGNRLFAAGFSYAPSTVFFSEQLEPEHWEADFNFETRTNDGQPVTALKAYNGNLYVFKTSSFHQLSNVDDANQFNFVLTEMSSEYGCLSNRAVAEYQNQMVFLDRKGIIRFNGANIEIISTEIDPIFARMNLDAVRDNSCITYDKQRNELLIDIPVDGSTQANLTVVYDIIADCWTTYKGPRPSVTAIAQSSLGIQRTFFGGYSGLVSWYGPSFLTDNGVGFTCVAKSGFMVNLGPSTTKQYRRLFMDSVPVGSSSAVDINLYQDYGASIIHTRTMYQSPFQSRIDFGVPAKSLAVEFVMGSTYGFQLNGFTIEYRFQRAV